MTSKTESKWVLLAAIAAAVFGFAPAEAQYRVGEDGRLLDANNRIGSGGYNTGGIPAYEVMLGNNRIITGNVTGGREFRGQVPYRDPREFRGGVAGEDFDRFIRGSAGVPAPYQPHELPASRSQPFYGRALATPPPPGFVQHGFSGTYTPPPAPLTPARDTRLGTSADGPPIVLPRPGDFVLPGPVDPQSRQPTIVTASPLLGVRQWNLTDPSDREFLTGYIDPDAPFRRLRVDPQVLEQMRDELRTPRPEAERESEEPAAPDPGSANLARPLPKPFESPEASSLAGKALGGALPPSALTGEVRADQSVGARLLAPPSRQSDQYAELQRRLNRYYIDRLQTDEDRFRDFLKQLRARESDEAAPQQPGTDAPAVAPETSPQGMRGIQLPDYGRIGRELLNADRLGVAAAPQGAAVGAAPRPVPMQIKSLAAGVKAEGLAKLLQGAEDLMKQGKYMSALDQYDAAEQVAPNNPLVWLGRAHAELAAGYYRKADVHLQQALASDPALLIGQYDLRQMIGRERLETVVKDLKVMAQKQEDDAGLAFLLAYLAYNTGSERQAAVYLDLAERRAGEGAADFYKLVRTHWRLPFNASSDAGDATSMHLSDVLREFEHSNILIATLSRDELSGTFKNAVRVPGVSEPAIRFIAPLPDGAATGPLGKWIMQNRKGAEVTVHGLDDVAGR